MSRHLARLAARLAASLAAVLALAATGLPAQASARGHALTVSGPGGRSVTRTRQVDRQPGQAHVARSVQGSGGHGVTATRDAQWAEGSFNGTRQATLNNGKSVGRTTSATADGAGNAQFSTTITGPNGRSRTVTGTATRNP